MLKTLWNYAVKVRDVEEAAKFYERCLGAEVRLRGTIVGHPYVMLRMGETRVILFDKAPYEDGLGITLPLGLLHVVHLVDDFDAQVQALRSAGVRFLGEPQLQKHPGIGSRMVALFETPDGARTEIVQILEDPGIA